MDKSLKVFIVDDDPDFIKLLRKYLETEAAKVGYSTSSVDAPPFPGTKRWVWTQRA